MEVGRSFPPVFWEGWSFGDARLALTKQASRLQQRGIAEVHTKHRSVESNVTAENSYGSAYGSLALAPVSIVGVASAASLPPPSLLSSRARLLAVFLSRFQQRALAATTRPCTTDRASNPYHSFWLNFSFRFAASTDAGPQNQSPISPSGGGNKSCGREAARRALHDHEASVKRAESRRLAASASVSRAEAEIEELVSQVASAKAAVDEARTERKRCTASDGLLTLEYTFERVPRSACHMVRI